jgi:hypothetical protein
MGYRLNVEGEDNRGLSMWFVSMKGLVCDVTTHDGEKTIGQIDYINRDDKPTVYLLPVDLHGRPVPDLPARGVEVDRIAEVNVW